MGVPAALLLLAALAVAGTAAAATPAVQAPPGPALPMPEASCRLAAGAPCGYILPILDLRFPDKPRCPGVPGAIDPATCIPLPAAGESVAFEGTVLWSWKESEDLAYPLDPNQPIVLTFGPTATDPAWLPFQVEPESFTITNADLLDPRNRRNDTSSGTPVVYFWYERPVRVTFTHGEGPGGEDLDRLAARQGVQPVYVKAKGTGSGSFYKESFGGEEFRFDATALVGPPEPERAAPAPALGPLGALAAVAWRRRGRGAASGG